MENKPALSIRELTEIIRNCQSSPEIERLISNIRTEFDSYSISDQGFLLAMIGITMMNVTADPLNENIRQIHVPLLLRGLNWSKEAGNKSV